VVVALTRGTPGRNVSGEDAWRIRVWSNLGASAMHEHDEVLEQLRSWQDAGHRVAVATVVSTWGSSPRPVGSQLGVNDAGEMVGSVSGGCIEGAVVKEALEVMAGAPPKLLDYGVSNEQAWEVGLACGGKLEVYIEAVD
jgi:xanthine/CO dehydrogenase XdhC/CoxF family maturation factor